MHCSCQHKETESPFYVVEEVAAVLKYQDAGHVRRLIREGRIPAIRNGGRYLVAKAYIDRLVASAGGAPA
jgi:excisionase family DNA binding protein